MKKVFITGVAGLLGSTFAKHLLSLGTYEVLGCDTGVGGIKDNVPEGVKFYNIDIENTEELTKLFKDVDTVFHTAALPYEGLSLFSPAIITRSIVGGTVSVASACLANNIRLLINCSSMARYGDQKAPFTEDMVRKPVDPYGLAKAQAEEHLELLHDLHGLNFVTVVPHNVIGVGQRYFDPYRNVVGIMINRALQDKSLIVYGDGLQKRSFSDVKDCIDAVYAIMISDRQLSKEIYNIGPDDNEITIVDLANTVAKLCDKNAHSITHYPDRPSEVKIAYCSTEKIRKEFNYRATVPLTTTINQMISWIKPIVRPFEYHIPLEFTTKDTPKTWTEKLF